MNERKWLARFLYLESVAGVPGMVAGEAAAGDGVHADQRLHHADMALGGAQRMAHPSAPRPHPCTFSHCVHVPAYALPRAWSEDHRSPASPPPPPRPAGMLRHLRSLRTMSRDNGWIHTLLEEAENERMHLLTFMKLRNPGIVFRAAVIAGQGEPGAVAGLVLSGDAVQGGGQGISGQQEGGRRACLAAHFQHAPPTAGQIAIS